MHIQLKGIRPDDSRGAISSGRNCNDFRFDVCYLYFLWIFIKKTDLLLLFCKSPPLLWKASSFLRPLPLVLSVPGAMHRAEFNTGVCGAELWSWLCARHCFAWLGLKMIQMAPSALLSELLCCMVCLIPIYHAAEHLELLLHLFCKFIVSPPPSEVGNIFQFL